MAKSDLSDDIEITPLSDEDIEAVAGGARDSSNGCSKTDCTGGGCDDDTTDIDILPGIE